MCVDQFVENDVVVVQQWQDEVGLDIDVVGQDVLQVWYYGIVDDGYDQQVGVFVGQWFQVFDVQCEDGWEYD